MKKSALLLTILFGMFVLSYAQNTMKLRYPKCELTSAAVSAETKGIKTFEITTQEEFDKYFKLTDGNTINFENNMVLAAIVGDDEADKYIQVDAASFISSKARTVYVRYDIREQQDKNYSKFSVAVIQKTNYKKVLFLKGKKYNMAISGG
ncbi:MAG: hypothetical protein IPM95_03390 [Sphingobacteriales bacterium]|jgi:hypothetical protein|nr:hypothetical protein [Sphingobacteriales bacterium]